jgi:hypothetical protein
MRSDCVSGGHTLGDLSEQLRRCVYRTSGWHPGRVRKFSTFWMLQVEPVSRGLPKMVGAGREVKASRRQTTQAPHSTLRPEEDSEEWLEKKDPAARRPRSPESD